MPNIKKDKQTKEAIMLYNRITKFGSSIWNPLDVKMKPVETNSWFQASIGTNDKPINGIDPPVKIDELEPVKYKCRKKIIIPTLEQKKILLVWLDAYIRMYNETNKVIKREFYNKHKINIDFKYIRTNYMKDIKENIYKSTQIKSCSHNTLINKHILDGAIKDVCTSYKSAFANLRNKNIKHFTIRYIKESKKQKIMRIEQGLFTRTSFCPAILGKRMATNDNSNFSDVNADSILLYNSLNNRFTLLIPEVVQKSNIETNKENSKIGIDPGVKTFLTGFADGHVLEIGKELRKTIGAQLEEIDKINNNTKLDTQKKHKAVNKRYQRINNLIDDLHWKAIKYLTDNYKTILLGNLSTKRMSRSTPSNKLDEMTKRVGLIMRLYVFKGRLKYKCYLNNCEYAEVNENHTTQMCSNCGFLKTDVGRNRIYECDKCESKLGRDINSARNIYMVNIQM